METALAILGGCSVLAAGICIAIGGLGSAVAEGNAAQSALKAMAQQPDEMGALTRTLFVTMAMLESTAIYALIVTFLILYGNPFWSYMVTLAEK